MIPVDIRNQSLESVVAEPRPKISKGSNIGGSRWGIQATALMVPFVLLAVACTDSDNNKPAISQTSKTSDRASIDCGDISKPIYGPQHPTEAALRAILKPIIISDLCYPASMTFYRNLNPNLRENLAVGYEVGVGYGSATMFEPVRIQTRMDYKEDGTVRGFGAYINLQYPYAFFDKTWDDQKIARRNVQNLIKQYPDLAKFIQAENSVRWTKIPEGKEPEFARALLNLPEDIVWTRRIDLRNELEPLHSPFGDHRVVGRGQLTDGTPYLVEVNPGYERTLIYKEGDAAREYEESIKREDVLAVMKKYLRVYPSELWDFIGYKSNRLNPLSEQDGEVIWSIPNPYSVESAISAKVQYGPNGELLRAQFEGDRLAKEAFDRRRFRLDRQPTLKEESSIIFGASIENTRFTEAAGIVRGTIIKYGDRGRRQDDLQFTITSNGFQATISFESLAGTKSLAPQAKQANFEQKFHPHKFAANGFLKPQYSPRKLGL